MIEKKNYNIGEWSEIYAFLRLTATKKLFAADEKLNRIKNDDGVNDLFFPILKIIREETETETLEFFPATSKSNFIQIFVNNLKTAEVSVDEFSKNADDLFSKIKNFKKDELYSVLSNVLLFLESVNIKKIKQKSNKKADISLQIHDIYTGYKPTVEFSIKSKIGSPPTLFNSSAATHFIFQVENIMPDEIDRINSIDSPSARFSEIFSENRNLKFVKTDNETFHDNLIMIDSSMPVIMAEMLIAYYSGRATKCTEVVEYLNNSNILTANLPKKFLEYKFKEFLCAVALGMKPATVWDGKDEANGGYIVIKRDGDIVAYHLYNRDFFKEYLYKETKFDKPDSRINYGFLYKENDKVYIKLTPQIRFK